MSNWLQNIFGPADPVDLSKAPSEPPRPQPSLEEIKANMDAQYAHHCEYQKYQKRQRDSLPALLRTYYDSPNAAMLYAGVNNATAPGLMRMAADEIDRLRQEITALKMEAGKL